MSSEFGKLLRVSVFGQSHGKAIGVNIDGLPAGESIDLDELYAFMSRRRPGKDPLSTSRKEKDLPIFLSGLENGVTCGAPLCAIIENQDPHSQDYASILDKPRPSHADYTAHVKWNGHADMRGGGHFSGRLTAPLCIAGGIAKQILARRGIYVGAHLASVGTENDASFPLHPTRELFDSVAAKAFPVIDDQAGLRMQQLITRAKDSLDSVGGIIECAAIGVPAGLGDPMFDGIENRLAAALFGIPAVKGVEFGLGFGSARLFGSDNNDPFTVENGQITPATNRAGGIWRHHQRHAHCAAYRHEAHAVHQPDAENRQSVGKHPRRAGHSGPSRSLHCPSGCSRGGGCHRNRTFGPDYGGKSWNFLKFAKK